MSSLLSHRVAQNSPSVTMEKGAYRIRRGPLLRNPEDITFPSTKRQSQAISASLISQEKRLVLLVMFLVFATFCCFGTAYYLFTTSSVPMSNTYFFRPSLATSTSLSQLDLAQTRQRNFQARPDEKFLSYLPHSGFHNQRIALENALVLARLLNRTLLVPPIRFGGKAIPYRNFTVLQRILDVDHASYLCQLSNNAAHRTNTPAAQTVLLDFPDLIERCSLTEEREPVTHAYLPWGSVTDFDSITRLQPTIQTLGSTHHWLSTRLDPSVDEVLIIADTSKYNYRFTDEIILDPLSEPRLFANSTYSDDITLSSLTNHPARLIQIGTLFGTRRLKLSDPSHKALRRQIRRHMALKHPLLQKSSADISRKVSGSGPGFLGAHLRCNDGYFRDTAMENSRMLWWKLVHGILGLSKERTRRLELDCGITGNSSWSRQFERYISQSNFRVHLPLDYRPFIADVHQPKCKGELHTEPDLERLNVPLFIATDSEDPYTDVHLGLFRQTFPCLYFLGGFPGEVEPIAGIRDPVSGVGIGEMLVPFLDAMVIARAARLVVTPHSTFSWYVRDVLWRVNHGLDIEERSGG
ncbi:hypothetical protein BJ322DRAFT_1146328 [Thelephora terrestris]|uniref:O-fucosyltransferase family protein n=1 Tax=Thelephora terrestris TaxID=56493 RepID=A0A9P6L2K4_9AGAM|nr:hypothetical protein BJ322DRAFT_1146328 [Thelephora terrestris]